MSNLDPRIEAVRAKYDLPSDAFWQIPQNKQWVCKHAALEVVAVKANVEWLPPQIIEANAPGLVTSMVVTGKMGDRVEWATGETNPTNYSVSGKQPAYPWAMSEKRAKDRVILKLVGIHGLVYSEDEMPTGETRTTDTQPETGKQQDNKPVSAAEMKRGLASIDEELADCHSMAAVEACAKVWQHIATRDGWSRDYKTEAANKFQRAREELQAELEKDAA